MLPLIIILAKSCEGLTYNSSVDILFRHEEIISICHKLRSLGWHSVVYVKVALLQKGTLLLTV